MFEVRAVSPPDAFPGELEWISLLLDAGLARYHLRKPEWTPERIEAFLLALPESRRRQLVLHGPPSLAQGLGLGGVHVKDPGAGVSLPVPPGDGFRSRSMHCIEDLNTEVAGWDAVFLSPIFPSLSKPGYGPSWTEAELRTCLKDAKAGSADCKIYALGGVDADTVVRCREWGFDGAVLHGTLWHSRAPGAAFAEVMEVLK